ncbi:MAG: anaerobic glycerol-3-phosphate dehydrogenase subunit GlpA [Sporomusaceae bacterium]|nr:anaerobic glycerol-3-phosphate dehydrogenase subunit GlpA [Sporomusaceae bacterium]
MKHFDVIVIGGGATGTGILRDLSMRGIKAFLVEQRDLAYGTSSRFHGLLHSGGRYAVKDGAAARECIDENTILRRIGKYCVEPTEGFFVQAKGDGEEYALKWLKACEETGIPVSKLSVDEARKLEPALSPDIEAAYRVPDGAIDGFRLVWQNAQSAQRYGGVVRTYTEVVAIHHSNGQVTGVVVRNTLSGEQEEIGCNMIVNAAGSWVGKIAALAGVEVNVHPDRGTLIAFNHRFTNRVVNRLRPPADADIFVPHGSITILGTTSVATDRPDDFAVSKDEVVRQINEGKALFGDIYDYRILRVFSGTRPIYSPGGAGRSASRNFAILDHQELDGLHGLVTIVGGKLTTYRLMAEKTVDKVCQLLKIQAACRTADEPLVLPIPETIMSAAKQHLPAFGVERAAARLGSQMEAVAQCIEKDTTKSQLVCECEMVTLAEIETVAADAATFTLDDIRRKTRMGMGTCQGAFCGLRGVGVMVTQGLHQERAATEVLSEFLEARWGGVRPVLWGNQLRETELTRAIYGATLNINGEMHDEKE